jgi:pimeloyl-ACP methyl ester carboxylesterase
LWKIDGYSATIARLQHALALEPGRNLFEFQYDWRRDNRVAARKLARAAHQWLSSWREHSGNENEKLVLVAHSMGGLVARYFLECLDGWRDSRALLTFGAPYRGSLNALGYLANGYAKSIGPLKVDLSATLRSFTSIYQLLPAFECVDAGDGRLHRVSEMTDVPNVDAPRAADALRFHREIRENQEANSKLDAYREQGYRIFPIVGVQQPTFQSALMRAGKLELLQTLQGKDNSGDGTVPRVSATPLELSKANRETFVAEVHASLQNFAAALDQVTSVLAGEDIDLSKINFAIGVNTVSLDLDDVYPASAVTVRAAPAEAATLSATIAEASTRAVVKELPLGHSEGEQISATTALPPGNYRITVHGADGDEVQPVTDVALVVEEAGAAA